MENCIVSEITKEELLSKLDPKWNELIGNVEAKTYWNDIVERINKSISTGHLVMPSLNKVFAPLNTIDFSKFKVLLIGQDPYPGVGVADGFAFSLRKGDRIQDSLEIIFKEIDNEYGSKLAQTHQYNGNLISWVKQGVLLLNSSLTIGNSGDNHRSCGWRKFVDEIITYLDNNYKFVTLAFGVEAKKAAEKIINNSNLVLGAGHPSPLNTRTPFLGCGVFTKCNELLIDNCLLPINWILPK